MTTDLTPAAWDYLADVARHCGMSWALELGSFELRGIYDGE
jgi:hypothetical protein